MKALIQFEIKNKKGLSESQLKSMILDHIVNMMDGWTKGENIISIEFIHTYENNNKCTDLSVN